MKKAIYVCLVFAGCVMLSTGCSSGKEKKSNNETKAVETTYDYAGKTSDDLLSGINDMSNVTEEEYINLVDTYRYVKVKEDMSLEKNITDEALKKINHDSLPEIQNCISKLIKSDSPQVRGFAVDQMKQFLFGVSNKNIEVLKDLIKTEKDDYVLWHCVKTLANEGGDPEVGKFLISMSKSNNAKIREASANALGNKWSKKIDGVADIIIGLMNDDDVSVRKAACKNAGKLNDESVIEPLSEILNNADDAEIHGSCVEGLMTLWFDFPSYENKSEKAYNATIDYFKKIPKTSKTPAWLAVSNLKAPVNNDRYNAWKKEAKYCNADEIYDVMIEIIKNTDVDWLARDAAIKVIKTRCDNKHYKDLGKIINKLKDDKAELLKNSYKDGNK